MYCWVPNHGAKLTATERMRSWFQVTVAGYLFVWSRGDANLLHGPAVCWRSDALFVNIRMRPCAGFLKMRLCVAHLQMRLLLVSNAAVVGFWRALTPLAHRINSLLQERLTCKEAMAHPYFNIVREREGGNTSTA